MLFSRKSVMNEIHNTHRFNMLIDFLQGSKKNKRLLYKLLVILYVIQIPIIIYLAAFITPGEYPAWWIGGSVIYLRPRVGQAGRLRIANKCLPFTWCGLFLVCQHLFLVFYWIMKAFFPQYPLLKKGWLTAYSIPLN